MHQNQLYVIQVNTKNKAPLALPAPAGALLPSEVKYSASLVRGLGCTHLVLGAVLFLLGVLGSRVEPETCWSGAGIWGGIAVIGCGISGLFAYHLWYKNYTIKAFLVSSVVCVVISVLAIILTIYGLVNRHEHYYYLLQQAEKHPWFRPYNVEEENQHTLSVSANQLVGFILEFLLAMWSVKISWKGVRADEFSSSRRDTAPDDLQSVVSMPHHDGQQIPLAALYQLLQAHPELLGSKNVTGGLGTPWLPSLDDRPHRSMDYQERVSRFLSHAIEDQNTSFSRSPSTLQGEIQDNPSPTRSSSITGSGGRGSPSGGSADTLVMSPDPSPSSSSETNRVATLEELKQGNVTAREPIVKEPGKPIAKVHAPKPKNEAEPKGKAPVPKDVIQAKEQTDKKDNQQKVEIPVVIEQKENKVNEISEKTAAENTEKKSKEKRSSSKERDEESISQRAAEITEKKSKEKRSSSKERDEENISQRAAENTEKKSKEKRSSSKERDEESISQRATEKKSKEKRSSSKERDEESISQRAAENTEKKSKKKRSSSKERDEASISQRAAENTEKTSKEKRSSSKEREEENISQTATENTKKSKEKRSSSKERDEEKISQPTEDQDNISTKTTDKRKSDKSEKRKSRKREKLSQITEEEERDNGKGSQGKEKKLHEEENIENTNTKSSGMTDDDVMYESSKAAPKDKLKKSKRSKSDKHVTEHPTQVPEKSEVFKTVTEKPSEATEISEINKTVIVQTRDSKSIKVVPEQVIDIKPPSEFQDNETALLS